MFNSTSNQVHVPLGATHHLIRQAYEAGGAYQWVREGWVNSIQAHAENVLFGISPEIMEKTGVGKRYIADDGIGMDDEQILVFMQSFGGGGRSIGPNENFGQGFKSSTLPWNKYGVVIASWTQDATDGWMVWIHYDEQREAYVFHEFLGEDEEGDLVNLGTVIPAQYVPELNFDITKLRTDKSIEAGQGTVFLMLGNSPEDDTSRGDSAKGEDESGRGITRALNTRFYTMPEGVKTQVESIESASVARSQVVERPDGEQRSLLVRNVQGMKYAIPDIEASGTVAVDNNGTVIEWMLCSVEGVRGDGAYATGRPHIWVEHSTVYEGIDLCEVYYPKSDTRTYSTFGVRRLHSRLWLRIIPPTVKEGSPHWGIYPQASRSILLAKGGNPLPMDDWAEAFASNLPPEIRAALDAVPLPDSDSNLDQQIRDRIGRVAGRFRIKRLVAKKRGPEQGYATPAVTGVPVQRGGTHLPPTDKPAPPHVEGGLAGLNPLLSDTPLGKRLRGRPSLREDDQPKVVWHDTIEKWLECGELATSAAVAFLEREGNKTVINVNWAHPVIQTQFDYWCHEYRADENDIAALLRTLYGVELVSKYLHIRALSGKGTGHERDVFAQNLEDTLTPEALLVVVCGLVNIEQSFRAAAGGAFGKAKAA